MDVRMPVMDGISAPAAISGTVRMKARSNDGLRHDDITSAMRSMLGSGH